MASPLQTRECKLTKKDKETYGFCLRLEKFKAGHLVRNVEKGSPAEKAGLKDGDRVLRVNGVFVDNKEHGEIADLVRKCKEAVTFLVLDERSYENAQKAGISFEELGLKSPAQHQPEQPPWVTNGEATPGPQPRLCYLVKKGNSYGFSLKTTEGFKGLYIIDLSPQGPASAAGVQSNDRLIEINGENVENDTHEQVVDKVRKSGNKIVLLLSSKETDKYYCRQNKQLKRETANLKFLPHKPRILKLKKGENGYGFYLRMEENGKGHVIKDIESNSPAAEVGLKDNDILVAVNGESVEALSHYAVVEKIRKSGEQTTLMVVDEETYTMYKMAHISPCLYYHTMPAQSQRVEEVPTQTEEVNHKPRFFKLIKGSHGFGFHLNAINNLPGSFIREVKKGGPADLAGLQDDDIVIEVNGVNVENEDYEKVVARIHDGGNRLTLLVCGEAAYKYFKSQNISITASMAESSSDDSNNPPAYTEIQATEPEKALPEPRERTSSCSSASSEEDTTL